MKRTMGAPVVLLVDPRSQEQEETEDRSSVVMVERLWSRLPEELVERILTWLPLPSLFRCRSVCKKWNTLMFSKDFHSDRHGSSPMPLLLLFGLEAGRADQSYDALRSSWHKLPRSFLPYLDVHPIVSAGGLLLCVRSFKLKFDYSWLCVCNPLMKSWRDLPVTSKVKMPMLITMVYDEQAKSFKVIVAGDRRFCTAVASLDEVSRFQQETTNFCWPTYVYDSATDSWSDAGRVPDGSCLRPTSVVLHGTLYALRRTGEVVAFDLEKCLWRRLPVPAPVPPSCDVACLTETSGAIYMAGYSRAEGVQGLSIWQIDFKANTWLHRGRLPDKLRADLKPRSTEPARLVGHGRWFFLMFGGGDGKLPETIKYDFVARVWRHIGQCPFDIRSPDLQSSLLPYEPRLDVFW